MPQAITVLFSFNASLVQIELVMHIHRLSSQMSYISRTIFYISEHTQVTPCLSMLGFRPANCNAFDCTVPFMFTLLPFAVND